MSPRTFVARSAAILSLAALGLAACESKTIVTPANNPLTIVVSPAAVTLTAAGQKAQFVAVVSGGQDTQAKTYSWVSSAPAVATVDANGIVTAVANGVATITATATADANVKSAGLVTVQIPPVVTPPPPATPTVSIQQVLDKNGNIVDLSNVSQQINVALNVDVPAGNAVSKVEVLVDGATACSQSFTTGSAQVGVEATSAVTVICSINTAKNAAGVATYANGSHQITARLVSTSGNIVASTTQTFVFNNVDQVQMTIAASKGPATDAQGLAWVGGDVTVTATPVIFSGSAAATSSVTITLTGIDSTKTTRNISKTITSGTNGVFTATFPASATFDKGGDNLIQSPISVSATTVNASGQNGPSLSGFTGPTGTVTRLDNLAPLVTKLSLPATAGSFINGAFTFASTGSSGNYAQGDTLSGVAGVDKVTTTIQVATASDTTANGGWKTVTTGADLAEAAVPTYIERVIIQDALGNQRIVYASSTGTPTNFAGATQFAVDLTPPTIKVDSTAGNVTPNVNSKVALGNLVLQVSDTGAAPSGPAASPVQYMVKQFTQSGTTCLTKVNGACAFRDTTVSTMNVAAWMPTGGAYDSVYVRSKDVAGNASSQIAMIVLQDTQGPVLGGLSGPALITGGTSVTFTTQALDNLDLGTFSANEVFGASYTLAAGKSTVGTYGLPLTTSASPSVSLTPFITSLQNATPAPTGAGVNASAIAASIADVAGNSANSNLSIVSNVSDQSAFNFTSVNVATWVLTPNNLTVCSGANSSHVCGNVPQSTTLSAAVSGPTQTFANPFARVNFYYLDANGVYQLIGASTGASASDNGTNRVWTFTATWTPAGFTAGNYSVIAIGVDANGHGLVSAPVTVAVADPAA